MPTPPERPKVTDPIAWGNLVKSWAKGDKPVPKTLEDFLSQCTAANVGLTLPSYVDAFLPLPQQPKNIFVLRLPPKELIEESEDYLNKGGKYLIPKFYDDRYDQSGVPLDVEQDQKLDFHAERTGDYTIGLCL